MHVLCGAVCAVCAPRTCMWQPPNDRRMSRCSAQKEFSRLVALLPVEVQMPVQVSALRVKACSTSETNKAVERRSL